MTRPTAPDPTPGPAPFELSGPLPAGTVMLEASAGTGKTFTIAGLAARWVAETDLRLPQLLVVTFTRAATAELRDRVRTRLVQAADHVEAVLGGAERDTADPVLAPIAAADEDALRQRHRRLTRAVGDVDVATISTIHGFCQHVLDGLGIASDLDRDAELVDDLRDLVEEVVDDLLVTTYLAPDDETPRIGRDELLGLAHTVVRNPTTPLVPREPEDPTAGLRLHLAARARREVARRARQRRLLSFDDLLTRLHRTLQDADRGGAARQALRDRYRVALIDEFQDTDPVQWGIVSRAFTDQPDDPADPDRSLVLIGDPKQAIYAFRGADVHAYLDAARRATTQRTLSTNWRSDAGLLRAFETLFDDVRFGHEDIAFRRVDHAAGHDAPRLVGAPSEVPLRLRRVPRHDGLGLSRANMPYADRVRDLVAADVAAEVVELLSARPQLVDRDEHGAPVDRRDLAPGDVAVLVRTNDQARMVQQSLREVDVPSVLGGTGSVFATPAATDWRRLLDALEQPASIGRVRALAVTCWVGWSADRVWRASEQDWDQLHEDVHQWARLLREKGVASVFRTIMLRREVARRLLGTEGGERTLADLEHVAELAHAATAAEHLGTTGLLNWFRDRVAEADDESADDRLRRLETDHDAVQVLTVHGSKGLQFPVVYTPFLWTSNTSLQWSDPPVFHDDEGGRRVDVGGRTHDDHDAHRAAAEREKQDEELRLLYVAVTRAKHQVVAWYAPAGVPKWSGLGRLLLNRDGGGPPDATAAAPLPEDDEAAARLAAVAAASDGTITVEAVPERPSTGRWPGTPTVEATLDRARFTRTLDEGWRRTSYSALTRLDHPSPAVGSEPDEPVKDDEEVGSEVLPGVASWRGAERARTAPHAGAAGTDDPDGLRDVALPLGEMPGGTHVGTFVHAVLEHTDFTAEDLPGEVGAALDQQLVRRRLELDRDQVVAGLVAAATTPLGPAVGGRALRDVAPADRLDELEFELPLDAAGGRGAAHGAGATPTLGQVADLLATHLPADDLLVGYPAALPAALRNRTLRGFLGGAIDLVVRRHTDAGPVFHVADHKTNRLGTWGEPLTAWDYRQAALADAMVHGHYPVQALLYQVAVHRMLRWRLPGYDPSVHLGSVLYLFLRGMAGPDTPAPGGQPCGVFAWRPPTALVTATSDLLHGVSA